MSTIHRATSKSNRGRQINSVKSRRSRSKYTPHVGAKELAKAKRYVMLDRHIPGSVSSAMRAAPIVIQSGR
jgi:hypothetical protein